MNKDIVSTVSFNKAIALVIIKAFLLTSHNFLNLFFKNLLFCTVLWRGAQSYSEVTSLYYLLPKKSDFIRN